MMIKNILLILSLLSFFFIRASSDSLIMECAAKEYTCTMIVGSLGHAIIGDERPLLLTVGALRSYQLYRESGKNEDAFLLKMRTSQQAVRDTDSLGIIKKMEEYCENVGVKDAIVSCRQGDSSTCLVSSGIPIIEIIPQDIRIETLQENNFELGDRTKFVLSHECGHIFNGDSQRRSKYGMFLPLMIPLLYSGMRSMGISRALSVSSCWLPLWLKYIKRDIFAHACEYNADLTETDSDVLKAGIDFLKEKQKEEGRVLGALNSYLDVLGSHPAFEKRINRLESKIEQLGLKNEVD